MWKHELEVLADISVKQPHAVYVAFTHGIIGIYTKTASCDKSMCGPKMSG